MALNRDTEEEFNNFLVKVDDINKIIKKMNSSDSDERRVADLEAKRYLGESDVEEKITDVNQVVIKVNCDRTVLNKKALHKKETSQDGSTMDPEVWMEEMSKDADRRHHDKLVRTERMETIKKQATKAFRLEEYEKALTLYNKAIDLIKDSCLLYNNRALTCIKLKLYEKAISDLNWALKLNEDGIRSWLLLAKANFYLKDYPEFHRAIKEAKERNPSQLEFIEKFVKDLTKDPKEISQVISL